MTYSSWIEIDLGQLKKNIQIIRNILQGKLYCLPVKANAYGHGLIEVSKLAQKEGVDYLAVANLQEGIALRKANISIPILLLGAFYENQIKEIIDYDLEVTVSSQYKAQILADYCKANKKSCFAHLEVDTGMRRTGVREETAISLYNFVKDQKHFEIKGIYSHFALAENNSDPFTKAQIDSFERVLKAIKSDKPLIKHLANSAGIYNFKDSYFDMARPAAISFGCYREKIEKEFVGIKTCFSVKSRISYFKVVQEGMGISYGHQYITDKQTRIVTVPVGYGDGYRRSLSNISEVLINGKRYPIRGIICMDQFMVDIGEDSAYVGDEVVLIGKQKNEEISIQEIARLCNTVSYDILCSFNQRLPRIYINKEK